MAGFFVLMNPSSPLGQLNQSMQAGTPALGQVSGGSPNFQPSLAPPPPTPMPDKNPVSMMHLTHPDLHKAVMDRGIQLPGMQVPGQATQPAQAAEQPVQAPPMSESDLIIKALDSRLKVLSKHESAVRDSLLGGHDAEATHG